MSSTELVHIYSGEHGAFWRPGANGYTTKETEAGVWTRTDAEARINGGGPEKKLTLMPVACLARVSRETILLNAHRLLYRKFRGQPLWAFVSEVCAVGATSAAEICRELGWNPHQDGAIQLKRSEPAPTSDPTDPAE